MEGRTETGSIFIEKKHLSILTRSRRKNKLKRIVTYVTNVTFNKLNHYIARD